jgi:NAD+ synthase
MIATSLDLEPIIGLLQHVIKTSGSQGFVVGLSGGIDSAVSAALCARAVGPSSVQGIFLPSDVTSAEDAEDVRLLGETLKIPVMTVPIGKVIHQYHAMPGFTNTTYLVGNLMARTRMTVLYYYANQMNRLVCGTSNYTEFLLGYCTKYGDNAADVQPIIHLQKNQVWDLARLIGIPDRIITKTPSAGLWHNQTDEDEIGMSYKTIDEAIAHLEKQSWQPATPEENIVMEKIRQAGHKQHTVPHLKR